VGQDDYGNKARRRFQGEHLGPSISGQDGDSSSRKHEDILRGLEGDTRRPGTAYPTAIADADITNHVAPSTNRSLKQALWEALLPDAFSTEKRFLPRGRLERICSFDAVLRELLSAHIHDDEDEARKCTEFVCGARKSESRDNSTSSREIFAILVLIDAVKLMPRFQQAGIRDDDLPFCCDHRQTRLWRRKAAHNQHIDFLVHPEDGQIMAEFYRMQWWVHVPFIGRDDQSRKAFEYYFAAGTVMPWTSVKNRKDEGGFGVVYEIEIHPDHHAFVCTGLHKEGFPRALRLPVFSFSSPTNTRSRWSTRGLP
jgi:hypothetical protein